MDGTMIGTRSAVALLLGVVALASCSGTSPQTNGTVVEMEPLEEIITTTVPTYDIPEIITELPPVARASDGGGEPRSAAYWALWNSCAPDNRSEQAAANGGREAGWVLVDDILADPGIGLGDHILTSCPESLALLESATSGDDSPATGVSLAGQLLTAELNRAVGAENCPAAEESVIAAQVILATASFDGIASPTFDEATSEIVPDLIDLLAIYNSGELCR